MGIFGTPNPETRRQVYAAAAKAAYQLSIQLDKIADFEPFTHSIHDRDTFLGSVYYNLDEVEAELREKAEQEA